ncbi:MAG: Ig-like domain-containing protein, partial [Muribaculaceae bacterium]|nr:Ig-like domain-containing protein [Muribaculaceae bacterium]
VAVGTANVTATCGLVSAKCRVNVEAIPVEQIILSMTEWSGTVGESVTLSAIVLPDDATNKHIVWSSSDEIIATVDDNGLIQLIASGDCIIKATTTDDSDISAECKIVSRPALGLSEVENDKITTFDVYNMQGEIIRINCDSDESQHLLPGIYIIRNCNYVNKIIIR